MKNRRKLLIFPSVDIRQFLGLLPVGKNGEKEFDYPFTSTYT